MDEDGKIILNLPSSLEYDFKLEYLDNRNNYSSIDSLCIISKIFHVLERTPEGMSFAVNNIMIAYTHAQVDSILQLFEKHLNSNGLDGITSPPYENPSQVIDILLELFFFTIEQSQFIKNSPDINSYQRRINMIRTSIIIYLYHTNSDRGKPLLDRILEELPPKFVFDFIYCLTKGLNTHPYFLAYNYDAINAAMAADGTQEKYLLYVFDKINNRIQGSLEALSDMVEWIDSNLLSAFPLTDYIKQMLTGSDVNIGVLRCVNALFKRDPENIPQYIVNFDMKNYLNNILKNPTLSADQFIIVQDNIKESVVSDEIIAEYWDIITYAYMLAILKFNNDNYFLSSFLQIFFRNSHEDVFEPFIETCVHIFSEILQAKDMNKFDKSINSLFSLMMSLQKNMGLDNLILQSIEPVLDQVLGSEDYIVEEEIVIRGVLGFFSSYYDRQYDLSDETKAQMMNVFAKFMSNEVISTSRANCYTEFLDLLIYTNQDSENFQEISSEAFTRGMTVLCSEQIILSGEGENLAKEISEFIQKYPNYVELISDSLQEILGILFSADKSEYIRLASLLVEATSCFDESGELKNNVFGQYLNQLSELLVGLVSSAEKINTGVKTAFRTKYEEGLNFVDTVNNITSSEAKEAAKRFFELGIQYFSNYDKGAEEIELLCKCMMKLHGLEYYQYLIDNITKISNSIELRIPLMQNILAAGQIPGIENVIGPVLKMLQDRLRFSDKEQDLVTYYITVSQFLAAYFMNFVPQERVGRFFEQIISMCCQNDFPAAAMIIIFPLIMNFFEQGFDMLVRSRFACFPKLFENLVDDNLTLLKMFIEFHSKIMQVNRDAFMMSVKYLEVRIKENYIRLISGEYTLERFIGIIHSIYKPQLTQPSSTQSNENIEE